MKLSLPKLRAPEPATIVWVVIAILASAPAWIVEYPPMMDVPFHLATMRVLHDYNNADFGFATYFDLTLGRTQYLAYYLVGGALANVLGVVYANIVLMSSYFAGTVLALRALLRAMGRDERLCLLVVPLLSNVLFMYGLFPFLVGIPLMFWALALAVRHFDKPAIGRGVLLGALTLALFYSHIFPFLLLGIGCVIMFPWSRPRSWPKVIAPFLPALLVLILWLKTTEAGRMVLAAATDNKADPHRSIEQGIADFPSWLTLIWSDATDEGILVALAVLVIAAAGLTVGDRGMSKGTHRSYLLLPLACLYFYFTLADAHGYIWLISQRFPVLFAMTAIPLVPMPRGARGHLVALGALGLAIFATRNTCQHFIKFQREEVGDFDEALDQMEPKKKVCALIYDKGTRIGNVQPFLHFGSYYQVKKGGVVMFTYAGYAHWPFDFKPGQAPPPGGPARLRWEWTPEQVSIGEMYPYYDYVLVRGSGFQPPDGTFHRKWAGDRWSVWERDGR